MASNVIQLVPAATRLAVGCRATPRTNAKRRALSRATGGVKHLKDHVRDPFG